MSPTAGTPSANATTPSANASTPSVKRAPARSALLLAGLCTLAMALTWTLAELVALTHTKDAWVLYDFTRLDNPLVEIPAGALLALLEPWFFSVWGVVLVALALRQRRPRVALAVTLVLSLAPASAELLKPLLAHPHAQVVPLYIREASWPSGHATAAMALVWCAVLVAPPARRRLVATLGLLFAAAVGCALLILAWHMPSDVLGGYLLASLWAALALAALRASRPASDSQARVSGGAPPCAPGSHSDSEPAPAPFVSSLTARLRMNSMSDSRFR
jgi:membrane-associated phospholipid phosphatase